MSKDGSDIFPNHISEFEETLRKYRKRLPLTPRDWQLLRTIGIQDERFQGILNGLDFVQKYGAQGMPKEPKEGSYQAVNEAFGYHTAEIPRGKYGERSKILEEMAEVEDAHKQINPIMLMLELSDLVGACIGYLATHRLTIDDLKEYAEIPVCSTPFSALAEAFGEFRDRPGLMDSFRCIDRMLYYVACYVRRWNLELKDVLCMTETTHRAFENGHRKPK